MQEALLLGEVKGKRLGKNSMKRGCKGQGWLGTTTWRAAAAALVAAIGLTACSSGIEGLMAGRRVGVGGGDDVDTDGDGIVDSVDDEPTIPSDGGASASSPEAKAAKALFDKLYTSLDQSCGSCHATGTGGSPKFLEKPDAYKSIRDYKGIVVKEYASSRLLTVGSQTGHSGGPGVEGALRKDVTAWLVAESKAIVEEVLPVTTAITLAAGAGSIDLSSVVAGGGAPGAKLDFSAAISGTIVNLSTIRVTAPAGTGLQVTHPLFIVEEGGRDVEDSVDSFSNVDQAVAAGASAALGPGTLVLTNVPAGAKLKVSFKALKKSAGAGGGDGGLAGGCKSVATFTSSARPVLQQCLNCHGTNGANRGSMDLSGLQANNDATACAQALNKVNLANKAGSVLLSRPKAGSGHPFQVQNAQTYDTGINGWINNE